MKALYDSQADALSIDIVESERWGRFEWIDDDYCHVEFDSVTDVPANVELLYPVARTENLKLLEEVARRYSLDHRELLAAAQAALSSPDREIVLEFEARA